MRRLQGRWGRRHSSEALRAAVDVGVVELAASCLEAQLENIHIRRVAAAALEAGCVVQGGCHSDGLSWVWWLQQLLDARLAHDLTEDVFVVVAGNEMC